MQDTRVAVAFSPLECVYYFTPKTNEKFNGYTEPSLTKDDLFAFIFIKETKVLFFGYEKQMIEKNSVVDFR